MKRQERQTRAFGDPVHRWIVALLCAGLVGLCATAATAEPLILRDDHILDYLYEDTVRIKKQPWQLKTLTVTTGADICCGHSLLSALDQTRIEMGDGIIKGEVAIFDEASLLLSGGSIMDAIWAWDQSDIQITGGYVGLGLYSRYGAQVTIDGGRILGDIRVHEDSDLFQSGGSVRGIATFHNSSAQISGGSVLARRVDASDESTIEIRGQGFTLDDVAAPFGDVAAPFGVLRGVLASGAWFENEIAHDGYSSSMTGVISLFDEAPSVTVLSDGSIYDVVDSATYGDVALELGGTTQLNLEAGGSIVNLYAKDTTQAALNGGRIDASVVSSSDASVQLLGTIVDGGLYATGNSSAALSAGSILGGIYSQDDAQITISGLGFALNGVALNLGDVPIAAGFLTGSLRSGDLLANEIFHSEGPSPRRNTGLIRLDLDDEGGAVASFDGTGAYDVTTGEHSGNAVEIVDEAAATVNFNGVVFDRLYVQSSSTLDLQDGTITHSLVTADGAEVVMSGGTVKEDLVSYGFSTVRLEGGDVQGSLYARGDSTLEIVGADFEVNEISAPLGPVAPPSGKVLVSYLAGGEEEMDFEQGGSDLVNTGTVALTLDPAIYNALDGSTSTVVNDSSLAGEPLVVTDSASLRLEDGGQMLDVYAAADSRVTLAGGIVSDDLVISGNAEVRIEGGLALSEGAPPFAVLDTVSVHDDAQVLWTGGNIARKLSVDDGAVVRIIGYDFQVDDKFINNGEIEAMSGNLSARFGVDTGEETGNENIMAVAFERGGLGTGTPGKIIVPEPGSGLLRVAALVLVGVLARSRRTGRLSA